MIEDLIIIIPTHNRQHYLGRVIKYYSDFPCKVYICDSSKEKTDVETRGNIIYRWVPQSNFYGKVWDVLNETSADFYTLSPDDDFLKEETLIECYETLKRNEVYSMGTGKVVAFNKPYDNKLFIIPQANRLQELNNMECSDKLAYAKLFEEHYQNILWSLFRKEVILSAFKCLASCNFCNGNFIELLLGIESLRYGKIFISNSALNYRESITGEHWGNSIPSLNSRNIERIPSLKTDMKRFKEYYEYDGGFAEKCLDFYLSAPFQPKNSFFINTIKYIIPSRVISFVKGAYTNGLTTSPMIKDYDDPEMVKLIGECVK